MKLLVVLKEAKPIIGSESSFKGVYGELEPHDYGVTIGDSIRVSLHERDISYTVEGLEGHWLEPMETTSEILVL